MSDPTRRPSTRRARSRRPSSPRGSPRSRPRSVPGPRLVPEVGIVLGSGLGGLADDLEDAVAIPFDELPGWPAATAPGHVGRLLLGALGGRPVVMLQGRFHLYEGNDPGLVVQPVLLFHAPRRAHRRADQRRRRPRSRRSGPGTLMVMCDHINLTGRNPLHGPERGRARAALPGPDRCLEPAPARARSTPPRRAEDVDLEEGVYVGLIGPNYETPAEVRMLAALGGHAVGMSTVLECIAARWVGPRGLRRLARHQRRRRLQRRAADARGGPRGRAIAGPRLARVIRRFVAIGRPPRLAQAAAPGPRQPRAAEVTGSSRPAAFAAAALLGPGSEDPVLVRSDRAMPSRLLNSSQ